VFKRFRGCGTGIQCSRHSHLFLPRSCFCPCFPVFPEEKVGEESGCWSFSKRYSIGLPYPISLSISISSPSPHTSISWLITPNILRKDPPLPPPHLSLIPPFQLHAATSQLISLHHQNTIRCHQLTNVPKSNPPLYKRSIPAQHASKRLTRCSCDSHEYHCSHWLHRE